VETVRALVARHPAEQFRLIVGGDILGDIPKWREFDELSRMAPLLVIPRLKDGKVLGGGPDEAALPDVSSTDVRRALAEGEGVDGAVPGLVLQFIRGNGL